MYPQRSVMTCGLATALEPPHFNHAPVRGAIGASFSRRSRAGSFNPRTRVGCDQCVCVSCLQLHCVSIHAPAWGATCTCTVSNATSAFQSTHPRGVRRGSQPHSHALEGFNPRTRVGCDGQHDAVFLEKPAVSIHAPAWGATGRGHGGGRRDGGFNPRTRVGCDLDGMGGYFLLPRFNPRTRVGCDASQNKHAGVQPEFQSTHPRGVRPSCTSSKRSVRASFNPRTRVGCDPI